MRCCQAAQPLTAGIRALLLHPITISATVLLTECSTVESMSVHSRVNLTLNGHPVQVQGHDLVRHLDAVNKPNAPQRKRNPPPAPHSVISGSFSDLVFFSQVWVLAFLQRGTSRCGVRMARHDPLATGRLRAGIHKATLLVWRG
jgi:hypothetical protein